MIESNLTMFNLDDEIARLRPADGESGRRAETLVKASGLRVVLVTLRSGAALHEHTAPGPISIHALRGRLIVSVGPREIPINAGELVAIDAGVRHAVAASEDGAFLLTIGFPGGDA
jgi:quercetin dioxygenase-like cupin family protein